MILIVENRTWFDHKKKLTSLKVHAINEHES